jgi:predicted ester cyclase
MAAQPRLSPTPAERNKAVVSQIFTAGWNRQQLEEISQYIHPQMAFHFRGETIRTGPTELQALIAAWHRAFADLNFEIRDLLAEGERVAVRLRFRGTHVGEWKGIAPTNRQVTVTEMMFFRFEDGRLVEAWEDYDEYGLRRQLRGLP